MRIYLAAALVMLVCGLAFGDAIDDAEAKRRGVSVEVIQLETARAHIVELEARVATLQAEVAKLKAAPATQTAGVTPAATAPAASGYLANGLAMGMSMAECDKALRAQHRMISAVDGVETCQWTVVEGSAPPVVKDATIEPAPSLPTSAGPMLRSGSAEAHRAQYANGNSTLYHPPAGYTIEAQFRDGKLVSWLRR